MTKTALDYVKTYFTYAIIVFILMLLIKQIITTSFPTISFIPIDNTPTPTAEIQMQELKKQIAVHKQLTFARAVENTIFDFKDYLFSQVMYSLKIESNKQLVFFYGRIPVCEGDKVVYRGANLIYDFDEKKPKYLEIFNSRVEFGCNIHFAIEQADIIASEVKSKCLAFDPEPMWMFVCGNKTFLVDVKTCQLKPSVD